MARKFTIIFISSLLIAVLAGCSVVPAIKLPSFFKSESQDSENEAKATAVETAAPSAGTFAAIDLITLQSAYESIYERVLPSVVSITVSRSVTDILSELDLPEEFGFGERQDQQAPEYQQSGAGSGFVWDTEGHIITNNHVIERADLIRVHFSDGTSVQGKVVGADSQSDLAVIKVDVPTSLLKPIQAADSTLVKIGQIVIAIGNPFRLSGSMTTGIISGLGRSLTLESTDNSGLSYSIPDVIQTDAAINPGNSGGVLVDIEGRLIGVTTAIESPVRANAGIGYVIPSVIVQKVVPNLIKDGRYQQPWIGISGTDLTPDLAGLMDLDEKQQGALVIEVTAGSPADKAGLKGSATTAKVDGRDVKVGGDVIIAADGNPVNDFEDLVAFLARYANVGQTITLKTLRDGKSAEFKLTLAARPVSERIKSEPQPKETTGGAWLGIQGADLTPAIAEAMGIDEGATGALVVQVSADSPADKAGIKGSFKPFEDNGQQILVGGDIITKVEDKPVNGMQSLIDVLGEYKPGDEVEMTLLRDGKSIEVEVTLGEKPGN